MLTLSAQMNDLSEIHFAAPTHKHLYKLITAEIRDRMEIVPPTLNGGARKHDDIIITMSRLHRHQAVSTIYGRHMSFHDSSVMRALSGTASTACIML
jgi:hypothetical protein